MGGDGFSVQCGQATGSLVILEDFKVDVSDRTRSELVTFLLKLHAILSDHLTFIYIYIYIYICTRPFI